MQLAAQLSSLEEWLGECANGVDGLAGRVEDAAEAVSADAADAGDGQVGEELGAGYADLCVGGDERGLGLLDVWASLEKLRRHARGQILRRRRECVGILVRDGARV